MSSRRVLVVDDEQRIREMLRDALSEAGWEVDTAPDSAEALQRIKENLYDAAVLDFALPDMDGVQLHSEIRRLDAELADHTIFISGVGQSEERLRYFESDAGGFLAKPFEVEELVGELEKVWES
jgi:two-component system alkaline phosphatase synthesis response regulator PhoP